MSISKSRADREWERFRESGLARVSTAIYEDGYTVSIEWDASNNPIYIGRTKPGLGKDTSNWQIKKLTFDVNNNVTDIQYPNGIDTFGFVWNSRDTYSYS